MGQSRDFATFFSLQPAHSGKVPVRNAPSTHKLIPVVLILQISIPDFQMNFVAIVYNIKSVNVVTEVRNAEDGTQIQNTVPGSIDTKITEKNTTWPA